MKSLIKQALIQLPPETDQMWQFVKTTYAQRVLANLNKPFLSKQKADKISLNLQVKASEIGHMAFSGELYNLRSLAHEIDFVKKHGLELIPIYNIFDGQIVNATLKLSTYDKNLTIEEESPVWHVSIFDGLNPQGAIMLEDETLSKSLSFISREIDKVAYEAQKQALSDEELIERLILKQKVIKAAQNKATNSIINSKAFFVDPKKGPYDINLPPQKIFLHVQGANKNLNGEWIEEQLAIYIYVSPFKIDVDTVQKYSLALLELKQTLYHEVRHMMQTFINKSKNIESGGLPKFKNVSHDPFGFKSEFKYLNKKPLKELSNEDVVNLTERHETRLPHPLRQIEFHTRLADEVETFNRLKYKYPKSTWLDLAKTFIGLSSFFVYEGEVEDTAFFFRELQRNFQKAQKIFNESKSKESERNLYVARNLYYNAAKLFLKYTI